jgi:ribosomal protein S18 acetylase RimI-like enzyme
MSIRTLELPDDFELLSEMVAETFQYPDHPEWSIQADEVESIAASMVNYRRTWWLVRLIQHLSPALRDIMHGHIWEEDGQIVGFTNLSRRGTTDVWYVAGVGVRPGYRRRGIARQLVSASLALIRERGGRIALLDVIEGNLPAYDLYRSVGFDTYSSTLMLEREPQPVPSLPPLPAGYVQEEVGLFEWRSRYSLDQRITPEHVLAYEPVEERRYRRPPMARLLMPLLMMADGLKAKCTVLRAPSGQVVAYGRVAARTREKGRNEISASLDPADADLAPYLVQALLHRVESLSPGRITEMQLPEHQSALVDAAQEAGFDQRTRTRRMGILLLEQG